MKYVMQMNRSEATERLAKLDGRELQPHEGFNRSNEGNWVIPIKNENDEVVASVEVFYLGAAKKRAAFESPDPEGQAIAQQIASQFNR